MQIHFLKEEMSKNVDFTKQIYEMKDLDGYMVAFDKFNPNNGVREYCEKMTLEKFLDTMENSKFFVSKLFIKDDEFMPIRYSVNARINSEEDYYFQMTANLTNNNYSRIFELYYKTTINRFFLA